MKVSGYSSYLQCLASQKYHPSPKSSHSLRKELWSGLAELCSSFLPSAELCSDPPHDLPGWDDGGNGTLTRVPLPRHLACHMDSLCFPPRMGTCPAGSPWYGSSSRDSCSSRSSLAGSAQRYLLFFSTPSLHTIPFQLWLCVRVSLWFSGYGVQVPHVGLLFAAKAMISKYLLPRVSWQLAQLHALVIRLVGPWQVSRIVPCLAHLLSPLQEELRV